MANEKSFDLMAWWRETSARANARMEARRKGLPLPPLSDPAETGPTILDLLVEQKRKQHPNWDAMSFGERLRAESAHMLASLNVHELRLLATRFKNPSPEVLEALARAEAAAQASKVKP